MFRYLLMIKNKRKCPYLHFFLDNISREIILNIFSVKSKHIQAILQKIIWKYSKVAFL